MQKNTIVPKLAFLSGIFISGILLIIFIADFSDQSKFPINKIMRAAGYSINLKVTSDPAGSHVWINNNYYNTTPLSASLAPGSYNIKVQQEGFTPCEKMIDIVADEIKNVNCQLFFKPTITKVASMSSAPFWEQDENLLYFNYGDMSFYRYSSGAVSLAYSLLDMPSSIFYSPTDSRVAITYQSEYSSSLTMLDLKKGSLENIPVIGLPSWSLDNNSLYVLPFDSSGENIIWKGNEKSFKKINLDYILQTNITDFWMAQKEAVIIFQSGNYLTYLKKNNNHYENLKTKNDAFGIGLRQDDDTFLSTDSDRHICITNLINTVLTEKCGKTKINFPLAISQDASHVYFLIHDNDRGAEDLWMLDIDSDSTILIKSDITGIGSPMELAVSPDGKQVAIINQFNDLLLLNLGKK